MLIHLIVVYSTHDKSEFDSDLRTNHWLPVKTRLASYSVDRLFPSESLTVVTKRIQTDLTTALKDGVQDTNAGQCTLRVFIFLASWKAKNEWSATKKTHFVVLAAVSGLHYDRVLHWKWQIPWKGPTPPISCDTGLQRLCWWPEWAVWWSNICEQSSFFFSFLVWCKNKVLQSSGNILQLKLTCDP